MVFQTKNRTLHIGEWRIDVPTRSITNNIVDRQVSPRAIRVLSALANAQGDVVSRSSLLDHGWPNVTVSDESLTQAITELRRVFKTGQNPNPVIQTVAKSGYRLTATLLFEVRSDESAFANDNSSFDLDAYRLCLDARLILSRSGPGSLERAEQIAREAAERAPKFALAQAEYAVMLVQRHLYRQGGLEGLSKALERAQLAVRLRPDLASAHAALGYALGAVERWSDAKRAFGNALSCDQNDADIHYLAARTLFAARDYAGATSMAERAGALDTDNFRPLYLAARSAAAFDGRRARSLGEQTLKRVRARLDVDPNEPRAVNTLGPLLAHLGEYEASACAMDAESSSGSPLEFYDVVARALMKDTTGAVQTLEAIADRGWCHPAWLSSEPALAHLNSERRYQRLVRQLGAA